MADYTLYAHPRSGNSYRVALMLSLTDTPFDFELVDLMDGGNLAPEFLKINPLGKVPALRHGDLKYVRYLKADEPEELYDLEADPDELTNLAGDPRHLALQEKFRALWLEELQKADADFLTADVRATASAGCP